jgi:hypothetical protein
MDGRVRTFPRDSKYKKGASCLVAVGPSADWLLAPFGTKNSLAKLRKVDR